MVLTDNVLMFFNKFIKINLSNQAIKACHRLRKTLKQIVHPVIVDFVYFDHENLFYGNRILLAKTENNHPHNFKPNFFERTLIKTRRSN